MLAAKLTIKLTFKSFANFILKCEFLKIRNYTDLFVTEISYQFYIINRF